MTVTLTWQTLITAGAVIAALSTIVTLLVKVVRWVDRQKKQDQRLDEVEKEQTLIVYGILACLKGLKEQGCNGPVTEAINKIERHINNKAHHQGGN